MHPASIAKRIERLEQASDASDAMTPAEIDAAVSVYVVNPQFAQIGDYPDIRPHGATEFRRFIEGLRPAPIQRAFAAITPLDWAI